MIEKVRVTNFKNETLEMELRHPEYTGLCIYNIEGIGGHKATVNTTDMASGDGAWYNSAKAEKRNIVLYIKLLPFPSIEQTRTIVYRYFPLKKQLRLEFETDEKVVYINGYVESNETPIFTNQEYSTVSIVCPDPFFYATGNPSTIFAGDQPLFEFPFWDDSVKPTPESDPYNDNLIDNFNFYEVKNSKGENNYTSPGETIDDWYFENGSLGNASIAVGTTFMKINQYDTNSSSIKWYTDFGSMVPNEQYTASYLDATGVHTHTFTVERSNYDLEFLEEFDTSTDQVHFQISSAAGSRTYRFQIVMIPKIQLSIELNAVKVEKGDKQTLAKDSGDESWTIVTPPPPDPDPGLPTIEFGNIIIDTRAIIDYQGSADVGIEIAMNINGPVKDIRVISLTTNEEFIIITEKATQIMSSAFEVGDIIHIITTRGQKRVYVQRGEETQFNITGAVDRSSTWFQLTPGDNIFVIDATSGLENLMVTFTYDTAYQGV